MRLILLGPPGSGKGTQAKLLSKDRSLEHVSTGDLLREAIRQGTQAGGRAHAYMKAGQLVPDSEVNDIIAERFAGEDRPTQFILDGYPRTLAQAAALDAVLRQHFLNLTDVVLLVVPDEEVVHRLSGRRICPNPACQAVYHLENKPPKEAGVCDECGTRFVQRDDDRLETVRARLQVYHKNTAELIDHYRRLGLLREVTGTGPIEQIHANILKVLTPQAGSPC
jgi:adenylate kinase